MAARLHIPQDLLKTCASTVDNFPDATDAQTELPLEHGGFDGTWKALLELVREAVTELGAKQVAYDLDTSPSQLSHALSGRSRHYVPLHWLTYLVRRSHAGDRIARLFAGMRAFDLVPRRELTPAEQLERLKAALSKNLGPELQRVVLADAFGGDK